MTAAAVVPRTEQHALSTGMTLTIDRWGDESDDTVMFLHGGGQTRHSWGSTARILAERGRHAVTVDLRGHGDSTWSPEGEYQLSDYAGDIAELLGRLGVRPVLVGASLGGMTGMMLEGRVAPGSIRALVLVDIVPRMNAEGADRVKAFMMEHAETGFADLDEVADAVAAYNPHRPRPDDVSGLAKNLRRRGDRWFWHWDPRMLEHGDEHADAIREVREPDLMASVMSAVTVPTMLVRGRMSDLVTEEGAREFLAEHPGTQFVDVSGAGHMVAGDRNDVFTAAVLDFIDTL